MYHIGIIINNKEYLNLLIPINDPKSFRYRHAKSNIRMKIPLSVRYIARKLQLYVSYLIRSTESDLDLEVQVRILPGTMAEAAVEPLETKSPFSLLCHIINFDGWFHFDARINASGHCP